MEANFSKLTEAYGEVKELTTPSGFKVVLREQNGNDDDVLSKGSGVVDGSSANRFVQGIVVHTNFTESGKLSLEDVEKMKLCDKYFIMIASRIFSIGQIVKFQFTWSDIKKPMDYEEDLGLYIWDYEKGDFPFSEDHEDYFQYRIKPHSHGKETSLEHVLSSGKKIKFDFMNGTGEKYLMKLPEQEVSKNQELIARNLQQFVNNAWVKVSNFRNFTVTDMVEIRNFVFENDPVLEIYSEIEHPITHEVVKHPIIGTTDFFFPRQI